MANNLTSKGQFVEIDFTAAIKQNGDVFDTTLKDVAKKAGLADEKAKSFMVCIGEGMVLEGFDKALEGKELGKEYTVELAPKQAFGERNASMVKIVPIKLFQSKGIMPYPGLSLNMDGLIARISAVSGGRVVTDFNNPLAGKDIVYKFKIKRMAADEKEKLACLTEVYFHQLPSNAIKSFEGKKATIKIKKETPKRTQDVFTKKAKELLGVDVTLEAE